MEIILQIDFHRWNKRANTLKIGLESIDLLSEGMLLRVSVLVIQRNLSVIVGSGCGKVATLQELAEWRAFAPRCGDLVAMAIVPSAILLVLQFVALILVALDLVVALRSQEASLAFATDNEFGGHVIRSFGGRHLRSLICGLPSTCHLML